MKSTLLLASMVLGLLVCGVAWAKGAASADVDVTPPTVTRTAPVSGLTCVDPAANVSAFFSEDMKASSINDTTIRLYRTNPAIQVPSSVRYGVVRKRAVLDPMEPLESGVKYRVVVGTRVEDQGGNRLDQDSATTGLQPKVWAFKTSTNLGSVLDCQQAAAQTALRNAVAAATSCAANHNGSYTECATATQLQPYGFEPTAAVTINGIKGNVSDWSAAMQHSGGGNAYTFATFGDNAGKMIEAPRGTDAPALPDRTEEWEAIAQSDIRNAAEAATVCAAEYNGSYAKCATVAQLQLYGFKPTAGVTINGIRGDAVDWSAAMQHSRGGSAYTFATFGDGSGMVIEAPRGTGAPTLPDRTAEWEALAETDTRNAAAAATLYAADTNGSYTGLTVAALVANGFVQSPYVVTVVVETTATRTVIESSHSYGGRTYRYDSATGKIDPVSR